MPARRLADGVSAGGRPVVRAVLMNRPRWRWNGLDQQSAAETCPLHTPDWACGGDRARGLTAPDAIDQRPITLKQREFCLRLF
jgi:hypothetical protein